MQIGYVSFQREEEVKCLGTAVMNTNLIQEEIKSRLKPENASCHSVQYLVFTNLLSKNLNIKI